MHANLETVVLNPPYDAMDFVKSVPSPDVNVYNRSVCEVTQQRLESISNQKWDSDQENAFFVGDLGEVFRQHLRWKSLLPRIEPFFGKFFPSLCYFKNFNLDIFPNNKLLLLYSRQM